MKQLKRNIGWLLFCWFCIGLQAQEKTVRLKILQTSDVHGNFFPYNFITHESWEGSLARVATFVDEQRQTYGDRLLLFDNGDILQGQPTAYYYNYMDTVTPHLCAQMMNRMCYDAGNVGNHDVETGRSVLARFVRQCDFPILGANIIDVATDRPLLPPYRIFVRDGVKVAVLGLITPAIPAWLPADLWKGLRFDDMKQTAERWMKVLKEKEQPDIVIGLFHAGQEAVRMAGKYNENASLEVARSVPGFDVVLMGHDHTKACKKVVNSMGDSVLVIDPGSNGDWVSEVELTVRLKEGRVCKKRVDGQLRSMADYTPDKDFMTTFSTAFDTINAFVSKKIGRFTQSVSIRPAYFGPSAFVDFIHALQLDITGADVSFAAPLSFDTEIKSGDVSVSDMFKLYQYENMLYVMTLSGREIKGFLEESYYHWTNRMTSPDDHLLWFRQKKNKRPNDDYKLQYFSFNFDSAAGICYTVDVTKPKGEKITIISMADGRPFSLNKIYKVALNSYRANGGGELLTKGAGIPQERLKERVIFATDKDFRFYLMRYIEKQGVLTPKALNQWRFIPEEWTKPAAQRDYKLLFED